MIYVGSIIVFNLDTLWQVHFVDVYGHGVSKHNIHKSTYDTMEELIKGEYKLGDKYIIKPEYAVEYYYQVWYNE